MSGSKRCEREALGYTYRIKTRDVIRVFRLVIVYDFNLLTSAEKLLCLLDRVFTINLPSYNAVVKIDEFGRKANPDKLLLGLLICYYYYCAYVDVDTVFSFKILFAAFDTKIKTKPKFLLHRRSI